MRILHLADVHLDRPFVGLSREEGDLARTRLREGFKRCLAEARERYVDVVTIGGDLWEDEHVSADTRQFVAYELAKLPLPVLLIAGNHDPHLPGGAYARTDWPPNVQLLERPEPAEWRRGELSVWGVASTGAALDPGFLDRFRAQADGRRHVLLLHGTAQPVEHLAEGAHCPFEPSAVRRAGFDLCLAGHVHAASDRDGVVYPGSPEPLGWKETGRHCVVVANLAGGDTAVELIDVAQHRYAERTIDCTGCRSAAEVADRLELDLADASPGTLHLRAVLDGELAPDCRIRPDELSAAHHRRYAELRVVDRTRPAYDLDALAAQRTATGGFVRELRARVEGASDGHQREVLELALRAGLNALDGRREVLRVD